MDQPGKAAKPTRGQPNREISVSLSPFAPENLVSQDVFGRPVPLFLHPQAEPSATVPCLIRAYYSVQACTCTRYVFFLKTPNSPIALT